jgi:hypothetical protein
MSESEHANYKVGDVVETEMKYVNMKVVDVLTTMYICSYNDAPYKWVYGKNGIFLATNHPMHLAGTSPSEGINFKNKPKDAYKFMVHYKAEDYPQTGHYDDSWYDSLKAHDHAKPGSKVVVLKNGDLSTLTVMSIEEARKLDEKQR